MGARIKYTELRIVACFEFGSAELSEYFLLVTHENLRIKMLYLSLFYLFSMLFVFKVLINKLEAALMFFASTYVLHI